LLQRASERSRYQPIQAASHAGSAAAARIPMHASHPRAPPTIGRKYRPRARGSLARVVATLTMGSSGSRIRGTALLIAFPPVEVAHPLPRLACAGRAAGEPGCPLEGVAGRGGWWQGPASFFAPGLRKSPGSCPSLGETSYAAGRRGTRVICLGINPGTEPGVGLDDGPVRPHRRLPQPSQPTVRTLERG